MLLLRARDGVLAGSYPVNADAGAILFDGVGSGFRAIRNIWCCRSTAKYARDHRFESPVRFQSKWAGLRRPHQESCRAPKSVRWFRTARDCLDEMNMWVANQTGNTVTKVRASDETIQGTFPVGRSLRQWPLTETISGSRTNSITALQSCAPAMARI